MILWVILETTKSFPGETLRQGGGEPASGYFSVGKGSYQPDLFKKKKPNQCNLPNKAITKWNKYV